MVNQPVVDTGVKTFTKLFFAHFTAQDVDLLPTQRRFLDKRLQETTPLPLHGVVTGAERAVGAVVRGRESWQTEKAPSLCCFLQHLNQHLLSYERN